MSPDNLHIIVDGIVAIVTSFSIANQVRNRKSGRKRDDKIDGLGERQEASLREFGSQLAPLTQTAWKAHSRLDIHDLQIATLQKEVERLREKK